MGGKTSTSTQSVSIPPEVLARYNAVNARAENVAATPFQPYSFDPSAFVAPLTPTQVAGIQNINTMQGAGFPFYRAGTQMTAAGAAPVGPITGSDIGRYYNPFTAAVAAPTYDALRQQQAQEMQGATANAIRSGAFGGDRSGLVAANLARQQQLGTAQAMAPIFQQGYSQAQEAAQRQQQVDLQNQARMLQAGQQMAGLGTGLQQLGIGGAQAQLAAGTAEQQTQQAGLQALYNQFLQQVGYPFQVAQFLANIAMGTGALSGSTTTTTQPAPFFSDRREKTNVKKLGKGLYAFDYKDDVEAAEREGKPMPPKRVGPMAQEIEKDKPGMVIDVNDYKVVDPGREKAAYGGLMSFMNSLPQDLQQQSMGGGVTPEMAGQGFARGGYAVGGGMIGDEEFRRLLAQQAQALGIYGANTTLGQGAPGGKGLFDPGRVQAPTRLATASSAPRQQPSRMAELSQGLGQLTGKQGLGQSLEAMYEAGKRGLVGSPGRAATANAPAVEPSKGLIGSGGEMNRQGYISGATKPADASYKASIDEMQQSSQPLTNLGDLARENLPEMTDIMGAAYGGVARHGYATDGSVNEPDDDSPISAYATPGPGLQIPDELKNKYEMLKPEKPPQQQSSGLGEILGLAKMGAQIAMGMPPFFADGGVVPRAGYQSGGEPEGEYTPSDRELGIRTLASEMSGKSWPEAVGIGAVMHNRLKSGKWGNTMSDVVLATKQFEPWNVPGNRNDPMRIDPNSARYRLAEKAYDASASGVDPTGGALNFYAPAAQAALRRPPPDWDKPNLPNKMIGATKFVGGTGLAAGEIPEAPEGLAAPAKARGLAAGETEPRAALIRPEMAQGVRAGVSPDLVQEGGQPVSQEGTTSNTYDLQRPPQRGVAAGISPPKSLTGQEQSWSDFLTSRQFVVPLLTGLGAMASSPSRYLGSAVLQGLGAGAQAFEEVGKTEAGIEKTRTEADVQRVESLNKALDAAHKSVFTTGDNITFVITKDGKYKLLSQWIDNPEPLIGGEIAEQYARALAAKEKLTTGPQSKGTQAAPQQPSPAPTAPQKPAAPGEKPIEPEKTETKPSGQPSAQPSVGAYTYNVTPSSTSFEEAKKEASSQMTSGAAREQRLAEAKAIRDKITKNYDTSKAFVSPLNDLAAAMLIYNRDGTVSTGFGANTIVQLNNVINSVGRSIGVPEDVLSRAPTAANIEDKLRIIQSSERAKELGERSVAALGVLQQGIVNRTMNPEAVAEILAESFVARQKDIDRAAYMRKMDRQASSYPGSLVGQSVQTGFDRDYRQENYDRDKAVIKQILMAKGNAQIRTYPNGKDKPPVYEPLLNYLFNKGEDKGMQQRINKYGAAKFIDQAFERPGVSRFFLGVAD
jgi:hypothetical protein